MPKRPAPTLALLLPLLASCVPGALPTLTLDPGTRTLPAKPLVCAEVSIVRYSTGKPGLTAADVADALKLPWDVALPHVRNLVGDTTPTIAQVQDDNCTLDRLCGRPNPTCESKQ